MFNARQLMAETKFFNDYSRYLEDKKRYETWEEAVARVMEMHKTKFSSLMTPELEDLMNRAGEAYASKEILGAQRALQFGGEQLLNKNAKMYNCVSSHANRPEFFGEFIWLLLCGCGAGFSVQKHHIEQLPKVILRKKSVKKFVAPDTIEGWAQCFDVLFSSFFSENGKNPEYSGHPVWFDLSQIRPKGAKISGGFKAPGPEPLHAALMKVEFILNKAANEGRKLKPIEVYDACMFMADAVISGGVRRSATICLFSDSDEEMIKAKTGNWYFENPQRSRSNNSVVFLRGKVTKERFLEIMTSVKEQGEPGFIFTDNLEFTYNPCVEIGKLPVTSDGRSGWQACNLTEINGGKCNTKEAFFAACESAAVLGTLQAAYTDFGFLSPASKEIIEREALIGVSVTGWMNNPTVLFDEETMKQGARIVKETNKKVAKLIGINPAARTTCVKPSGNASVILLTASGIHGEHSPLHIRHVQLNKESEVAQLLAKKFPSMTEEAVFSSGKTDYVFAFPIVSPKGSIYKDDLLGVKQLEFVKKAQQFWVDEGTNVELCTDPRLRHNVSNTITVDDWDDVSEYVFENQKWFCGISFLSAVGDRAYVQAPFTEVFTPEQIVAMYGGRAMFASGLITRGLDAFNNDLWMAISTAQGVGIPLEVETHENAPKRDWVRQFNKFVDSWFSGDSNQASNCLKDVYNFHKWSKILNEITDIDWATELGEKKFTQDAGAQIGAACAGGVCSIEF